MFRGVTLAIAAVLVAAVISLRLQRIAPVYSVKLPSVDFVETQTNSRFVNSTNDHVVYVNNIKGPEHISYDERTGAVYTGSIDGKLWRIDVSTSEMGEPIINAEVAVDLRTINPESRLRGFLLSRERPTSEEEDGSGGGEEEELILTGCDAAMGLIQIRQLQNNQAPHDVLQLVSPKSPTEQIHFCNSIEKTDDGFFITDSHGAVDPLASMITLEASGRLLFYEAATKKLHVLREGLLFPNGLYWKNKQERKLIVGETFRSTLWEVDLITNNWKVFSSLPVSPDNIHAATFGKEGGNFVVAGPAKRSSNADKFYYECTLIRKLFLAMLPRKALNWALSALTSQAAAVWVSPEGKVIKLLHPVNFHGLSSLFSIPGGIQFWGSYLPTQSLMVTAAPDL